MFPKHNHFENRMNEVSVLDELTSPFIDFALDGDRISVWHPVLDIHRNRIGDDDGTLSRFEHAVKSHLTDDRSIDTMVQGAVLGTIVRANRKHGKISVCVQRVEAPSTESTCIQHKKCSGRRSRRV